MESYGILVVDILEEMETIAKAIRPITYKKTFRNLEAIFVYSLFTYLFLFPNGIEIARIFDDYTNFLIAAIAAS